jgi:ATP phosphoribosyltransferase
MASTCMLASARRCPGERGRPSATSHRRFALENRMSLCISAPPPSARGQLGSISHGGRRGRGSAQSLSKRAEETLVKTSVLDRSSIRMGIPSKGRMAEDTLDLLQSCQLRCVKPNPRQYFGQIPAFPDVEVWFQRASDVVRKLSTGDLDLGIVGTDMFAEFAQEDADLVVVHDALEFGRCKLALGVPVGGKYTDVHSLDDLRSMDWCSSSPMRVVTGYTNIARRCTAAFLPAAWTLFPAANAWWLALLAPLAAAFVPSHACTRPGRSRMCRFFRESGFEDVVLLSADGALEAAPAMGAADIILDLVSTGVTLRENNLKTIKGGDILDVRRASACPLLHGPIDRRRSGPFHRPAPATSSSVAACIFLSFARCGRAPLHPPLS